MGETSFTITVSDKVAKLVKEKIASGEYESESEAFSDGLIQLDVCEFDDATLLAAIKPAYDAYLRDPSRAMPAEEVFAGLSARYQARKLARSET